VFVAVHRLNEIAEIDPASDKIVERYSLPGCQDPHGLLVDGKDYLAFAACESNAKLAVVDLTGKKLIALLPVGDDPDVLAFDTGLRRLYVAAESGVLTIFDVKETGKIETIWSGFYAAGAHTISVDSNSHRVFLPLQNVDGRPVLRIAMP
jgi:DNA-binding beta-propeller fold protein YncE